MNAVNLQRAALALCLGGGWAAAAAAQAPAQRAEPTSSIAAGYEIHRDRLRYEFANPSSIDTPFLVPHTFAQTYTADNQWLVLSARYRAFGERLESEFGVTPVIITAASDIDTFHNPGGDVVTSGTSGEARSRAFRFAQWSDAALFGLRLRAGYRYRRDWYDFLPADVVVRHTNPPAETRRFTTDREYTTSQVHNLLVDVTRPIEISPRWTLIAGAALSPIVFARLTTRLPDKYPEALVADARSIEVEARLQLVRESRWPVLLGVEWGKGWSYKASRRFDRDALQVSMKVAYRP